jgi:pimeloyl-ACP methyl ester carboxylesterase
LTRRGIAVLRCDDRGFGKSTGNAVTATTLDFATDTAACVDYLKQRRDIDSKRIGLIGHSEGGLIAPMVAAEKGDIAFVVLLAGPGTSCEELLIAQGQAILKAMKVDDKQLAWQRETQVKLMALIKEGADGAKLKAALDEQMQKLPKGDIKKLGKVLDAALAQQLKMAEMPWTKTFLTLDSRTYLKKVRCPVLALNGGKDLQVIAKENLEGIEKAVKEGGNTDVTVKEFHNLNHLFQTSQTGEIGEYGKIEETIAPKVLDLMSEWIVKKVGQAK